MTRVLLTGGSGFLAAHVLDILLKRGHSVVTTVRSTEKADRIRAAFPNLDKSKLDFAIVKDVAQEHAFDKAIESDPPFEAVIHTASPFHFNVTDVQKELLDPAIIGTTGILKSIKQHAPTVKRVVITSSFASIVDGLKGTRPGHTYSEKDWNPVTHEQALENPMNGYRASKTMAERAAWDFLDKERPGFTISTICPPLVFGPVTTELSSLTSLNTSNERIRDMLHGKMRDAIPDTGTFTWVDVRDVAMAHVRAIEVEAAANQRYFVTAGHFSNRQIAEVMRKNFPDLTDKLPTETTEGGDFPEGGVYGYDNSKSERDLALKWRTLEETIVDSVRALQTLS